MSFSGATPARARQSFIRATMPRLLQARALAWPLPPAACMRARSATRSSLTRRRAVRPAGGGAVNRFSVSRASGALHKSCAIRSDGACRVTCLVEARVADRAVAVLGDRKGSLSLVALPPSEGSGADLRPEATLLHAHKKNSVTSLTLHPDGCGLPCWPRVA